MCTAFWCLTVACCVQVKRKDPPEAATAGDNKRARPSTPVDDELEDEGTADRILHMCNPLPQFLQVADFFCGYFLSDRDRDPAELPSDDSKMDGDSASAKRRHSRPLELDSEGEEEVDTSGKEEESLSDREEEPDEKAAADRLSTGKVCSLQKMTPDCLSVGLRCRLFTFWMICNFLSEW